MNCNLIEKKISYSHINLCNKCHFCNKNQSLENVYCDICGIKYYCIDRIYCKFCNLKVSSINIENSDDWKWFYLVFHHCNSQIKIINQYFDIHID